MNIARQWKLRDKAQNSEVENWDKDRQPTLKGQQRYGLNKQRLYASSHSEATRTLFTADDYTKMRMAQQNRDMLRMAFNSPQEAYQAGMSIIHEYGDEIGVRRMRNAQGSDINKLYLEALELQTLVGAALRRQQVATGKYHQTATTETMFDQALQSIMRGSSVSAAGMSAAATRGHKRAGDPIDRFQMPEGTAKRIKHSHDGRIQAMQAGKHDAVMVNAAKMRRSVISNPEAANDIRKYVDVWVQERFF